MNIYLPIAEQSIDLFLLLGLGGLVGFLSGMFGVGGGFLMTPLLIFNGIPPDVAVATEANQIVASSVSGSLAQWRRNNVDLKMGGVLLAGGIAGAVVGVQVVKELRQAGQVELFIALAYVFFLGLIGTLMLLESLQTMKKAKESKTVSGTEASSSPSLKKHRIDWIEKLPFKSHFKHSRLYISVIPPLIIGAFVGFLAAIMGVGGGFIMVPAMIYILRMPTNVVVGTSLFQIVFVTAAVTVLHSVENHTVDSILAILLMIGGVIGAQIGARYGAKLNGEQLRSLLALMVLAVCAKMAVGLIVEPDELYSMTALGGEGH